MLFQWVSSLVGLCDCVCDALDIGLSLSFFFKQYCQKAAQDVQALEERTRRRKRRGWLLCPLGEGLWTYCPFPAWALLWVPGARWGGRQVIWILLSTQHDHWVVCPLSCLLSALLTCLCCCYVTGCPVITKRPYSWNSSDVLKLLNCSHTQFCSIFSVCNLLRFCSLSKGVGNIVHQV